MRPIYLLLALAGIVAVQWLFIREALVTPPDGVQRALIMATTAASVVAGVLFVSIARTATVAVLGACLNLVVMAANGGAMPVAFDDAQKVLSYEITDEDVGRLLPRTKDVLLRADDIRLAFLSDRIRLWFPTGGSTLYSLGDLVLYAGAILAAGEVTVRLAGDRFDGRKQPRERKSPSPTEPRSS